MPSLGGGPQRAGRGLRGEPASRGPWHLTCLAMEARLVAYLGDRDANTANKCGVLLAAALTTLPRASLRASAVMEARPNQGRELG